MIVPSLAVDLTHRLLEILQIRSGSWHEDTGEMHTRRHRRLAFLSARWLVALWLALGLQGCLLLQIRPTGEGIGVRAKDLPAISSLDGDKVYSLLGPDRIPAIDEPRMVVAAQADFMAGEELVLGVTDGEEARAYSLWHLDRHEIVNDVLGGEPIAATW